MEARLKINLTINFIYDNYLLKKIYLIVGLVLKIYEISGGSEEVVCANFALATQYGTIEKKTQIKKC